MKLLRLSVLALVVAGFWLAVPAFTSAAVIFDQTPPNEDYSGPILNNQFFVSFSCALGLDCGVEGQTVYNVGVWLKKIGNPEDIRLVVTPSFNTNEGTNFSNPVLASSISDASYNLVWFHFPNGVVMSGQYDFSQNGVGEFFQFQHAASSTTYSATDHYSALYHNFTGDGSGPQQWCTIFFACRSSRFNFRLDDSQEDLSQPIEKKPAVFFLPGFEASKLYSYNVDCSINCEDRLWEPHGDGDVEDLFLDENGNSVVDDIYTKTEGGVMEQAYSSVNIYESFIDTLSEMKEEDGSISDYAVVPYDWRFSLDDLLNRGYEIDGRIYYDQNKSTSTPYILQELHRLADNPATDKITIVAHSNGGLLTKAMLKYLQDTNDPILSKIERVIFVAVPHLGTPQAIAALLHGYDAGIPFDFGPLISDEVARQLGNNLQSAYNFLPSASYFGSVSSPAVAFDIELTDWIAKYGQSINSGSGLNYFLTDIYGRVPTSSSDTDVPVSLREPLLNKAKNTHIDLDSWTQPASMEVINIAGWGIPSTVRVINYEKDGSSVEANPDFTIDGDGTVVTPSALYSNGAGVTRYWVDVGLWNEDHQFSTAFGILKVDHKNILEIEQTVSLIKDFVTDIPVSSLEYISMSMPSRDTDYPRLVYSLHSPLALNMYDNFGNHTGISTTTGFVEEGIPGTYFLQLGDKKYIFSNTGIPVSIVMDGYDTGTFTFNIEELNGDTHVSETTFKDIPTTPDTQVSLSVQNDINTVSNMLVDLDGDGDDEYNLEPKLNDIVTAPAYFFGGFLKPINDTTYNPDLDQSVFKAGSTVPVKFQLMDLNREVVQAGALPIWSVEMVGPMSGTSITEEIYSDTATVGNTYKWDDVDSQYVYNWKTNKLQAGFWYKVFATLDDGYSYSVIVGLK